MRDLLRRLFANRSESEFRGLVDRATQLGLRDEDRRNALNFLDHNELGEAFDLLVTQLYEYDVKIDGSFLNSAYKIGDAIKMDRRHYDFLEKLLPRS